MSGDMAITLGVLACALALFASDRVRLDIVALGATLSLALCGVVSARDAVAGFGDPIILILAGLFVVGEGLAATGVADRLGDAIARAAGSSELRLSVGCMVVAALLSAFMSSTGTVAMLMPVVLRAGARVGVGPGKLMMPLAFATLLGGMLTLVATPPNLVANGVLVQAGEEAFGFFSFTPFGAAMVAAGVAYMATVGRRLLPGGGPARPQPVPGTGAGDGRPSAAELIRSYGLPGSVFRLRVPRGSPLAGMRIGDARLRSRYRVTVLSVGALEGLDAQPGGLAPGADRGEPRPGEDPADAGRAFGAAPEVHIPGGSALVVQGEAERVLAFAGAEGLDLLPSEGAADRLIDRALGVAEALLTPRSRLLDKTLAAARFRELFRVDVIGILRLGQPLPGDLVEVRLQAGDALLLRGTWEQIDLLRREHADLVILGEPRERAQRDQAARTRRSPTAMAIAAAMLLAMSTDLLPPVTAALLAAWAMVVTGCLSMDRAYRSIHWQALVLIAGMLPLAAALERTGALHLAVGGLASGLDGAAPHLVLAALFAVTSLIGLVLSNTATSVILAPAGLELARALGAKPQAFLMIVALASSTAFMTPVATPVNMIVLGAGGYRFRDFLRVGLPLHAIVGVIAILLVEAIYPLG